MEAQQGPAAPESGDTPDPEILALLDFDPVPRKREVEGAWTPALQREFIARLAVHGSATKASDEMGKNQTGIMKLYRSPLGASFRAAWDAAVDLAARRRAEQAPADYVDPGTMPPTIDHRRKHRPGGQQDGPLPGPVINEFGEYEDEASFRQRGEDAKDSIRNKLLRARRLYLEEISSCPGKRAAFEILTELPVDWEKAKRQEPQEFEPWTRTNQRQPDMILTAESGWSMGEIGYGPDKKAAARKAIDEERAKKGLEPIDW